MKRQFAFVALGAWLILAGACGSNDSASPTAPSPAPAATVTAVTVTSAAQTGSSFQLTATTRMSDGSASDVTALSQWESSSPALVSVSSTGLLTVVSGGDVDVRATYLGVVGTLHLLLAGPPVAETYAVFGVVTEVIPALKPVSGVRLQMTSETGARTTVTSDAGGIYRFTSVAPGVMSIEAGRDGYLMWRVTNLMVTNEDRQLEVVLYPTPPTDATGASATSRCADGTWSWSETRAGACAVNGGIAYTVCPEVLCHSVTVASAR